MEHKISLKKIKGVSKTLLIPLRGRYLETKRDGGIVNDPKSVEIIDSIEHDFTKVELPWVGQIMVSVRTEILDEATIKFLTRYPDSVVVNLGCGLDTRIHRVDNGLVLWYDLDLPECIKLREKFFQQTDRFKWPLSGGAQARFAFETESFKIMWIAVEDPVTGSRAEIELDDYREIGGLTWPCAVRVKGGGYDYCETLSDWELSP